ncbi:MAG TPA: methyl-accepting chemotaxis protein [Elusimicrobiales bacterium]|nr:methyl-accepting chemotaxis protein [Elusimicrobiales bacterium]
MPTDEKLKKPYQRRTILIKKNLQFRYIAIILTSVIVGFMIVGFEIVWNIHRLFINRPALLAPLMGEIQMMLPVFGVKLAAYLAIILIVSVIISHKMVGPLYKFEKSTKLIAQGDLTHRVYLRKGDHLTDLQKEFNNMVSSIQQKVSFEHDKAVEVSKKLKEFASRSSDENLKKQLNEQAENLLSALKEFKI